MSETSQGYTSTLYKANKNRKKKTVFVILVAGWVTESHRRGALHPEKCRAKGAKGTNRISKSQDSLLPARCVQFAKTCQR